MPGIGVAGDDEFGLPFVRATDRGEAQDVGRDALALGVGDLKVVLRKAANALRVRQVSVTIAFTHELRRGVPTGDEILPLAFDDEGRADRRGGGGGLGGSLGRRGRDERFGLRQAELDGATQAQGGDLDLAGGAEAELHGQGLGHHGGGGQAFLLAVPAEHLQAVDADGEALRIGGEVQPVLAGGFHLRLRGGGGVQAGLGDHLTALEADAEGQMPRAHGHLQRPVGGGTGGLHGRFQFEVALDGEWGRQQRGLHGGGGALLHHDALGTEAQLFFHVAGKGGEAIAVALQAGQAVPGREGVEPGRTRCGRRRRCGGWAGRGGGRGSGGGRRDGGDGGLGGRRAHDHGTAEGAQAKSADHDRTDAVDGGFHGQGVGDLRQRVGIAGQVGFLAAPVQGLGVIEVGQEHELPAAVGSGGQTQAKLLRTVLSQGRHRRALRVQGRTGGDAARLKIDGHGQVAFADGNEHGPLPRGAGVAEGGFDFKACLGHDQ